MDCIIRYKKRLFLYRKFLKNMTEESQFILDETAETMESTIKHLESEFQKIRAGKASPMMLQGVKVEYYGTTVPIEQTANIGTPDARQIIVMPFDKSAIGAIDKAIQAANLGFNPKNEGDFLRILVPPLTEERRKELVKQVKSLAEEARIALRNIRQDSNTEVKNLKLPEDLEKRGNEEVQELINKYNKIIDEKLKDKEQDLMTI